MKRWLVIPFVAIALPVGAVYSLFWLHNQPCLRNTKYSEQYSQESFDIVGYGLPRAKVIEALGAPLSVKTDPNSSK